MIGIIYVFGLGCWCSNVVSTVLVDLSPLNQIVSCENLRKLIIVTSVKLWSDIAFLDGGYSCNNLVFLEILCHLT